MKYRVNYARMNQSTSEVAKWEQLKKDFSAKEAAIMFAERIAPNVAVRNINIQPVPDEF
jgi:hypothetical protein|tara:strand:- start:31 stop:207 length:177 start_codon:yes stop_codon:yes gene_type:complete